MRIKTVGGNIEYGSLWLCCGNVSYGIEWHSKNPIRKRMLLRAKEIYENRRFGAPWLKPWEVEP